MGRGPGSSEEVWQRLANVGFNAQAHGNNTRNLAVYLALSQASKNAMSFLLSLMFPLQQNREQEGRRGSTWKWG
jgi:hypothetical protein